MVEVWTMATDRMAARSLPPDALLPSDRGGGCPAHHPHRFWQLLATLQEGRFTFVDGPRDASTVLAAAGRVEALDVDIRSELGVPPRMSR